MNIDTVRAYIESNEAALATWQKRGNTELVEKIEDKLARLKEQEADLKAGRRRALGF